MTNEIRDYGEIFCEAVDKIVNERLSGIHFDQTILCTVVDDKDKAQGIYTVINGEVKFEAYSLNNTYRKDDEVYVQIPSGDWNEQKIIISKKTKDSKMSVVYEYPFDNYMDITGNIIKNTSEVRDRLIANGDVGNIILWSYNVDDNYNTKLVEFGSTFSQYTRLGIQAQFQSWLKMHPAVSGSYGLILRVEAEKEDSSEKTEDSEDTEYIYYEFKLDAKDMLGDPYNFETYTQQEKLFNIADIPSIRKMELSFYQDYDFYDNNKDLIVESEDANLFVKDVYISFGYGTKEFDNDVVKIYTLESPKYSATVFPPENNHRKIDLRWIHNLNNKLISVDKERYLDYTITWYRHQLGAYSHTAQSGADWVPLSKQSVINGYLNTDIIDADWFLYNETAEDGLYREPGFNYTWLLPDITLAEEKIKAILSYEGESGTVYLQSNILTFSNREEVQSTPTVDAVSALSITCEDETNGNYYMYGQNAGLLDGSQSGMERIFKVYLKGAELESAESVSWTIPTTHTMIDLEDSYYGAERDFTSKPGHVIITRYGNKHDENIPYNVKANNANIQKYKIKGYYTPDQDNNTIQCRVVRNGITYTATKQLSFGTAGTNGSEYTLFLELSNNVHAIPCVTEDQEFDTDIVKQNGYKVVAHLYDYSNKEIEVNALNNYTIKWEWLINSSHLKLNINNESDKFENIIEYVQPPIQPVNGELNEEQKEQAKNYLTMNELYILKATLNWRGESTEVEEDENGNISNSVRNIQKLEAYLPIPIYQYQDKQQFGSGDAATYRNLQPSHIAGATQVLYSSDGYPQYYKDPYKLYFTEYIQQGTAKIKDGTIENKDIEWEIYPQATISNKKYFPTLTNDNRLQPISIYVKDAEIYGIRAKKNKKIIWTQPILVLQNRYPNSAVNAWDGKTLTLDKETGVILSTAIAAGKKESDNSFTGVMLGEWGENGSTSESSISYSTGVYGFNKGAMSYAFKDDGTAFIGKSGHGRILFDGKNGKIKSAAWEEVGRKVGMCIDLDDGSIEMQSGERYIPVKVNNETDFNDNKYYLYGPHYTKVENSKKNTYTIYYSATKIHQDVGDAVEFAELQNNLYVCYENYKKIAASSKFSSIEKYYNISYQNARELYAQNEQSDIGEGEGVQTQIDFQSMFKANRTKYFISNGNTYRRITESDEYNSNTQYFIMVGTICADINETNFADRKNNLYTKEIVYKSVKNTNKYSFFQTEEYFIDGYEVYTGDIMNTSTSLYAKDIGYYLAKTNNNQYNEEEIYYTKVNTADGKTRYITLSAAESNIPLSIGTDPSVGGRKFRVNWDGNLHAKDAYLEGTIESEEGHIGGWEITSETLEKGSIVLNSRDGSISGATIVGGTITGTKIISNDILAGATTIFKYQKYIKGSDGNYVAQENEYIQTAEELPKNDKGYYQPNKNNDSIVYKLVETIVGAELAKLGAFQGSIITGYGEDGKPITADSPVVGIQAVTPTNGTQLSIVLDTNQAIRLTADDSIHFQSAGNIYFYASGINFKNIPANKQEGIYARFA